MDPMGYNPESNGREAPGTSPKEWEGLIHQGLGF